MTSKQVVDSVTSYIRDENAKYAILIDGAWGSGKTYLYDNYLVNAINSIEIGKNRRKHNVYISLYGISSIDSLAKQLITNYLVYAGGKGNKFAKAGLKTLTGVIGVVGNALSFSIGSVSADLSKVGKKIKNMIEVKDMVICFDDMERCTIPMNEFFGLINNLTEHCNCKVIILADENNIGKIYANTNLEKKYLTVISGNRKVVERISDGNNTGIQNKGLGESQNGEITVEEVKKLNERLYSENYLYKDIKEKVIGKTVLFRPSLDESITELICGNEKNQGIMQEGQYKDYLVSHIEVITREFEDTDNYNLRIIREWIFLFKKIHDVTIKYFSKSAYLGYILTDFLRYSIWVLEAQKKNKKIVHSANYGSRDIVYFEGHEYKHVYSYSFIDAWIIRDAWNDEDLVQACRSVIKRKEKEEANHPNKTLSTGTALEELKEWTIMEDEQVKNILDCLEQELIGNKYAYYDYSNILASLLYLQEIGLYKGNIDQIKNIMIDLIKADNDIQEENEFPKDFSSEEMREKYNKIYRPISEERKMRNRLISKDSRAEKNVYRSADDFYDNCCMMENYYSRHKAFVEFIDFEKLYTLINESDNEGIYTIRSAFKAVYYMGNLKDFYTADIAGLIEFRKNLMDESVIKRGGITRGIAIDSLIDSIKEYLVRLGVEE